MRRSVNSGRYVLIPLFNLALSDDLTPCLRQDAARVSYQIEQRNCLIDISNLRFITAFFADLYSAGLISEVDLTNGVRMMLQVAQGPTLFHIFIYDYLCRALTCSGKKLSTAHWRNIATRWNRLSSEAGISRGPTTAVISLFLRDAALPEAHCAIEWDLVYDDEMEDLCEDIASGFRYKMWDEEEQRVGLEVDQEHATDSMRSVRL